MRSGTSMGVMAMANKRGPRDVCPDCDAHCEQVRVPGDYGGNPYLRPYSCSGCGRTHALCDLKWNTSAERAEAYERKKAYHRKWYAEHAEHCRRYSREYARVPENHARLRRRQAKRYRDDPEFRDAKREQSERWRRENPEGRKAICRRYYENHREEILYKQNAAKLRKLRREGTCGSAT